jgi:VWFA-related protein
VTTIKARSNLVVIDVVVSDSKQNPVHGLSKQDFQLLEDGKPQTIRNFEEHTALTAAETAKIAPAPKLPPGLFTNQTPVPANGPVNVLLLDYLNTPLESQPYAKQQLIDYLGKAPPGTRIAIFALSTSLVMLQGFSSDPAVLKNALLGKKGSPQASAILSDPEFGGAAGANVLETTFSSDALDPAVELANIQRAAALEASFESDLRTKITLGAFDLLSRYLIGIPGRKNVIWFSGSFPLSIEPDVNLQDAFDSVVRNDDEVRKTDNMLTRAQIAVYPVDARGLFNDPANGAQNGASSVAPQISGNTVIAGNSASASADAQMAFLQQTAQEHETMQAMAEDTGGHAFLNTNNLTQAVKQAIENGSNYYTLTYSPNNKQWDGRFRSIKVKVEHPGVKLAYRNGYYADDPDDPNRNIAGTAATAVARPTTMATAMMHGGPDPAQIVLRVRVRPAATPPEDTPVKDNLVNPDPKLKVTGPYRQYGVDVVPDRHEIKCTLLEGGDRRCSLEVATYIYDKDGALIVKTTKRLTGTLSPDNYTDMLVKGMAFHQEVSVPVKGDYYLRTAVHDVLSDKVGAVEIPLTAVARLAPLKPLPVPEHAEPNAAPASGSAPASVPAGEAPSAAAPPAPASASPAPAAPGTAPK